MEYTAKQFHDHFVGKRLLCDVLNKKGEVILTASTILTNKHKQILEHHQASLTEKDVIVIGPFGNLTASEKNQWVDEAVEQVRKIYQEIQRSQKIQLAEIRKLIVPIIHHWVDQPALLDLFAALHAKNNYLYRHIIAVGLISTLIGKWLNLQEHELLQLTTSALLIDVGILEIPSEILNKPDKLTPQEFEIMKRHTIIGYEMIKKTVGTNYRHALAALQHHERMDGKGYPLGIKGEQIDLFSRIISVADVFHAMASKRVYRNPSPFYEVLSEMEQGAYGALDSAIVRLFIDRIMQNVVGCSALLTDGRKAKIVYIHAQHPTLPLVQSGEQFIDLSINSSIKIEEVIVNE